MIQDENGAHQDDEDGWDGSANAGAGGGGGGEDC